jgi:hypothetical protein
VSSKAAFSTVKPVKPPEGPDDRVSELSARLAAASANSLAFEVVSVVPVLTEALSPELLAVWSTVTGVPMPDHSERSAATPQVPEPLV